MNLKAFELYLQHLQSYQNFFFYIVWAGVIITVIGAILVFLLRDKNTKETMKVSTKEGYHVHFSSSFGGGLVSIAGAVIVFSSIFGVIKISPQLDGEGWKNVAMSVEKDLVEAVASGAAVAAAIKNKNDNTRISGLVVTEATAAAVKKSGGKIIEASTSKIDTSQANASFLVHDKLYFYPSDNVNEDQDLKKLNSELNSGALAIETFE